jgi:signal transduction histidine kinase
MRERSPAQRERPTGLPLRTRLSLLLGLVAVFLVAILAVQLAYQARLANERDDLIHRVARASEATGDLRAAGIDQETAIRGYALTGDESFLEPYEQGVAAAEDAFDRLEGLLDNRPHLDGELQDIRTALDEWRRLTAEPALEAAREGAATARSEEFLVEGRERFDRVLAALDTLDADLEVERDADIEDLDDTFRAVMLVMFAQIAGLFVLGGAIALALNRQVLSPLARLGRDARLVADGDLGRPVVGEGPPELVRLGADVEAMRARIVDELDELSEARAELERHAVELARSNDDLEQFAYVASHDLQEPLRKVSGFCQLLERRYGDQLDDRAKEYIRFASDSARRMQVLINDLLTFSRAGRTTEGFVPVDLTEVAYGAVEVLADPIEEAGATVTVGDLPVVHGDRGLLAAVLQNLIANAVKFRGDEPPRIDLAATADDGEWTVTVADNGIGIDPLYADQIFTIFKRLHNKADYAGTGIGLALSKKIIEFHGGRIWLEPTDGPGATFAFALPTTSPAAPQTRDETDDDDQ